MPHGTATIHVRPVVDREQIDSLVDVQEMLLELDDADGPTRLLEIGRKRLPGARSDSPNWGYVRTVVDEPEELADVLDDDTYTTQTQGRRHQSATRVAAEGTWELARASTTTYLRLELDGAVDDELIEQLHVHPFASYVMNVKNPRVASQAGLEDDERAELPDELQRVFDGNRWSSVDPPELLDHVGVEFVLVPADLHGDPER